MGDYEGVAFKARIDPNRMEFLHSLHEENDKKPEVLAHTSAWKSAAQKFDLYYQFQEFCECSRCDFIPFGGSSLGDFEPHVSVLDDKESSWDVSCCVKIGGFEVMLFIGRVLPYLIAEPTVVYTRKEWEPARLYHGVMPNRIYLPTPEETRALLGGEGDFITDARDAFDDLAAALKGKA